MKTPTFNRAMAASDDLLNRLHDQALVKHPLLELFANLWRHRNNVPVMTTMYESYQEMASPLPNGKTTH